MFVSNPFYLRDVIEIERFDLSHSNPASPLEEEDVTAENPDKRMSFSV